MTAFLSRMLAVAAVLAALPAAAAPTTLFLSPAGRDSWTGAARTPNAARTDGPLATLDGARLRIAALRASGTIDKDGVDVRLLGGTYRLPQGFRLTAADDISPAPLTIEVDGKSPVIIDGGAAVDRWTPLADDTVLARLDPAARPHIVVADLRALGMTDYGAMVARGFTTGTHPAGIELFAGGRPMTLARWPNDGQWALTSAATSPKQTDNFYYAGDRPSRWANDDDVWVHGYWMYDWADDTVRVAQIDTANQRITVAPPQSNYGYTGNHRWYVTNVLEELDEPGEWYLDRPAGKLYFWPPADVDPQSATVSIAENLFVLDHVANATIRGLILRECRGDAVKFAGTTRCRLTDCTIRDIGNNGVTIDDAVDTGVARTEITQTGDGGVVLHAGDRKTLTPGRCYVDDCRIHDYARWCRAYRPAVNLYGVGNRVSHNAMYNAPHQAVQLYGNDCVVEYNEIHDVVQETGDAGALYSGRDWTMRGNVIRYNYFHDLGHRVTLDGFSDAMGVYLDDTAAGFLVFGNLFVRAGHAVLVGGGRDNVVANNVFVECKPLMTLDARGVFLASTALAPGGGWHMQEKVAAMAVDQLPYRSRYPELLASLSQNPNLPWNNSFLDNRAVNEKDWLSVDPNCPPGAFSIRGNLDLLDPQFVDPAHGDYHFKPTSPALTGAFRPLPLDQIGPRR